MEMDEYHQASPYRIAAEVRQHRELEVQGLRHVEVQGVG